jgi:hypothetical protein
MVLVGLGTALVYQTLLAAVSDVGAVRKFGVHEPDSHAVSALPLGPG